MIYKSSDRGWGDSITGFMRKLHGKQIKFCRWGGLSPVKQKGYDPKMPTFHSPPMRKGIYAFVWPYIETFLLTGKTGNNHVWSKETSYSEKWKCEGEILKPSRIFVYDGDLWHHLGEHLRSKEIKRRKGSWVKTSYNKYCKALCKELHTTKSSYFNNHHKWGYDTRCSSNNPTWGWSMDHLEVFIERI